MGKRRREKMKSVVLSEKFNALVKQSERLQPRTCKCGYAPQVKVHYAFCGPTGVKIECERCKRKSGIHGISEVIRCGK